MNSAPQYYIKGGVRRAVAAREAGKVDLPALIMELGKPDVLTRVLLSQLHSPKDEIQRDYRYIHYSEYPTLVLKTEPPPIEVEVLGLPGQLPTVPLANVVLS